MRDINKENGIVIWGKQASGKTTLAQSIAKSRGSYDMALMSDLFRPFGLVFAPNVKTVIVEGFYGSEKELVKMKSLISEDKVLVERKGRNPKLEKMPNFIFCSGDKNPIPLDIEERRFIIINT